MTSLQKHYESTTAVLWTIYRLSTECLLVSAGLHVYSFTTYDYRLYKFTTDNCQVYGLLLALPQIPDFADVPVSSSLQFCFAKKKDSYMPRNVMAHNNQVCMGLGDSYHYYCYYMFTVAGVVCEISHHHVESTCNIFFWKEGSRC
jgi:hypothetical protein